MSTEAAVPRASHCPRRLFGDCEGTPVAIARTLRKTEAWRVLPGISVRTSEKALIRRFPRKAAICARSEANALVLRFRSLLSMDRQALVDFLRVV